MINGVPISKGNIIAMRDFFRTVEDMYAADPKLLQELDAAITRDRQARTTGVDESGKPVKAPSNDDIQKITKPLGKGSTYMDLNKENEEHFAPPKGGASPDGKDHKSAFEKTHRQALDEAHKAAVPMSKEPEQPPPAPTPSVTPPAPSVTPSPPPGPVQVPAGGQNGAGPTPAKKPAAAPEKAVAMNMFAAHYLTDAFSAGHLINKKEVMDQAKEAWGKMSESGLLLKENSFTQQVSQRVLADAGVKAKMADKQMINLRAIGIGAGVGAVVGGVAGAFAGGGWGALAGGIGGAALGAAIGYTLAGYDDVTPERLSELLHLTSRLDPDTFFNIFARMVHDKLNREGVEVTNGEDTWKLAGDETLNTESLRVGRKAVAESEKNLEEAATNPSDLPYDEMIARVWRLVPHPTDKGQKFIDSVRDELTDAANPAAVDEAVKLSVEEIETAIDQMIEMHVLRQKPGTSASSGSGGGGGASTASEGGRGTPRTPATSGAEEGAKGAGAAAPDRVPATIP